MLELIVRLTLLIHLGPNKSPTLRGCRRGISEALETLDDNPLAKLTLLLLRLRWIGHEWGWGLLT